MAGVSIKRRGTSYGRGLLAADLDFVETEQDASSGHGNTEAQLGTEAGKQQKLINLFLNGCIVRTREIL